MKRRRQSIKKAKASEAQPPKKVLNVATAERDGNKLTMNIMLSRPKVRASDPKDFEQILRDLRTEEERRTHAPRREDARRRVWR